MKIPGKTRDFFVFAPNPTVMQSLSLKIVAPKPICTAYKQLFFVFLACNISAIVI
jgi:hypothetical protein